MKKIITCLKTIFLRMKHNKMSLVVGFLIIPISVIGILYISQPKAENIMLGIINGTSEFVEYLETENISYELLKEAPKKSEIVLGKYTGLMDFTDSSTKVLINYKGDKQRVVLESIWDRKYKAGEDSTDIMQSIFGYLFMILMIQAVLNFKLLTEERMNGLLNRLFISNLKFWQYICAYIIYNFLIIYAPTILSMVLFTALMKITLPISMGMLIILTAVAVIYCVLIALAICIFINKSDSAIMVGNLTAAFTSILGGTFGIIKGGGLLAWLSKIMPQRIFLDMVDSIVNGRQNMMYFILIAVICILLFTASLNRFSHRLKMNAV